MMIPTHRTRLISGLAALVLLAAACADHAPPLDPEATHPLAAAGGPHVVQVAPPQGNPTDDRASVLAALEAVRPGGTVQFAPGTYVIGQPEVTFEYLEVTVPRIALLGHPEGTTLRGCDPEEVVIVWGNCFGFELSGGRQTVRNLSFQDFSQALVLGKDLYQGPAENRLGGYRVEDNTFRNITFAVSAFGHWLQPAVIRSNTMVNVGIAVEVYGMIVQVLNNDISAPEPHLVPAFTAYLGIYAVAWADLGTGPSDHNVIAGNRIDGYPFGFGVEVWSEGAGARHNVVRDNTVLNTHVMPFPWDFSAPLFLFNDSGVNGLLEDNLVQGNRVVGADGVGLMVYFAQRNRVVNNTISGIALAESFRESMSEGNGSGIWLSPDSDDNQILNNSFSDVALHEVVLEGDYNHVATRSASDVVRDLGVGNRITGPGSVVTVAAPAGARAGVTPAVAERAEAARMLRERVGLRARMLENVRREATPR